MTEHSMTPEQRAEMRQIRARCGNRAENLTPEEIDRLAAIGEEIGVEPSPESEAMILALRGELGKRDAAIEALSDRIKTLEQAQVAIRASISNIVRGKGAENVH
jgi:hypothetical protein